MMWGAGFRDGAGPRIPKPYLAADDGVEAEGLRFGVQGLGLRVEGVECRVER